MKGGWAIRVARANADALTSLRRVPGIEVAEENGSLWLKGRPLNESLKRLLLGIPADQRFKITQNHRLLAEGTRIPGARLPSVAWTPIQEWIRIQAPESHPPGNCRRGSVPVQLVRTGEEAKATLLLTSIDTWLNFASTAPAIRLKPLRFAVTEAGLVLIRGEPLPPITGSRWVEHQGIGVPAGFKWMPAVDVDVLHRLFAVGAGSLVLWHENGTFSRVMAEQFVEASRSAVRLSQAALSIMP